MFRKSVTFFTLVALFWVLLWVIIPDASPDNFTISDIFRGLMLLFSFMAFVFSLFILTVRYKGIEIFSRLFPQAGVMMWAAKNAYQFSQPKTNVHLHVDPSLNGGTMWIKSKKGNHEIQLDSNHVKTVNLGHLTNNPTFKWQNNTGQKITQQLSIKKHLKNLGKNLQVDVLINKNSLSFIIK